MESAPSYTLKKQKRTRVGGFVDEITSIHWNTSSSEASSNEQVELKKLLPKLYSDTWLFKNYWFEGRPYRLVCTSITFLYFKLTQVLRADINYTVEAYDCINHKWVFF